MLGKAAKRGEWFKRIDWGEELAELVLRDWDNIASTDFVVKINAIKDWAYA